MDVAGNALPLHDDSSNDEIMDEQDSPYLNRQTSSANDSVSENLFNTY